MIKLTGKVFTDPVGGNSDQYTKQDTIWNIAARFNQKSREMNGQETSVVRREVKEVERVGIL